MRKRRRRIRDLLRHLIIKNALAVVKTTLLSMVILLSGSFFVLLLIGCSDIPYAGSMLTPDDFDKYLIQQDSTTLCLTNGYDERCVTLIHKGKDPAFPIIYIFPKKVIYVFYYEGIPIIRAERPIGNTGAEQNGGGKQPGIGGGNNIGVRNGGNSGGTNNGNNGGKDEGNSGGKDDGTGGNNVDNNDGNNDRSEVGNGGNTGDNNDGNNDRSDVGNSVNNRANNDGVNPPPPPENDPNPSGHNPPDNVLSHYVYNTNDDRGDGWIVWVYYPHNYVKDDNNDGVEDNPRKDIDHPIGCGFTLSISGGIRTNFSQTSGNCIDNDNDNRDDYNDVPCSDSGSDYSAQFFVASSASKITLTIGWTAGMYYGQTQVFNIMKEISMKDWDEVGYDPGHTNQDGW